MTIAEGLDNLRARHPGCVLAAFGDLGTRLVLRSSSENACPQEYLDQLCNQAAQTFALSDRVRSKTGSDGGAGDDTVVLTPGEVRIIVRSEENRSDFLCCVCEDDRGLPEITASALEVLREVSTVP